MPLTQSIVFSHDAYIRGILGIEQWAVQSLTFSFPTSGSFYESFYGSGEPVNGFAPLNSAQMTAARAAFTEFSSVTNLMFTEITESTTHHADLRLAQSSLPETAWAYFPSDGGEAGDAWFGTNYGDYTAPAKGNYAYVTFLHELGHALGLDHAHEGMLMPTSRDTMEYTVMSYSSYEGASPYDGYTNESWGFAQSLMMYDIAALQHMYGADYSTQSGNTIYSWSATTGEMFINGLGQGAPGANRVLLTVWDGGGVDTYDYSNYTTGVNVDLQPGGWTRTSSSQLVDLHIDGTKKAIGNIANALLHNNDTRSLIENAIGGNGNDTFNGNVLDNILVGGGGHDTLRGSGGSDTLLGGEGWDAAGFDFSLLDIKFAYRGGAMVIEHKGALDRLLSIEMLEFSDDIVTQDDGNPLVDDMFYLTQNNDVYRASMEAEDHYYQIGWQQGRDPNGFFDTSAYLETYRDVAAVGMNPLEHYALYGWKEGRDPSSVFDTNDYLRLNPDVAAAGITPLAHYLSYGIYEGRKIDAGIVLVDDMFYFRNYRDVAASSYDPEEHYARFGWHEGRDPNAFFDTSDYLAKYTDVAAAGMNPLEHYKNYGWHEGRDPSKIFDSVGYLELNPDVAAAGMNPLEHYLNYGIHEGRSYFNDGLLG
ncbi:M10 family metallopeptidase [Ensifer sp. ENS09]|uniref:M10 family metallopeptidase n=1 Tax=Ensifer sp. ENS09 TaxID=2769263 RepID=UPI001783F2B7|nr:M10 family metallopeptidase [Ensifer sp. ENS09]MBD9651530.1 M10 family metallopeptidase [Ensifer sp. ENS09]